MAGARAARNPYTLRRLSFGVISLFPSQSGLRYPSNKTTYLLSHHQASLSVSSYFARQLIAWYVGFCDGGRKGYNFFIFVHSPSCIVKPIHRAAWYVLFWVDRAPRLGFKSQFCVHWEAKCIFRHVFLQGFAKNGEQLDTTYPQEELPKDDTTRNK